MERYSRQELYQNIGKPGQKKISAASVCVVGIGALGTVASELLVRAGIGEIKLIDRDFIELNNLQRQTLFTESDVGKIKAETASETLKKINSQVNIIPKNLDLTYENIEVVGKPNVILACTDNMESRFLLNDYALKNNIPFVYGVSVSDKGYILNVAKGRTCLRCIFKSSTEETCDTIGVLNSNTTTIASIMANETIKIILGAGYEKDLIRIDFWKNEFSKIKVSQNPKCPACLGKYEYLFGEKNTTAVKMCGKEIFQLNGDKKNLDDIEKNLKKLGDVKRFKGILHFKNITVFEDGRALVKAKNKTEARKIYDKFIGN
ncbi:MAG: ThiF family adenylyltransferase [Nanoarchaeota archaeon]